MDLVGVVARPRAVDTDVDLLVEFEPGHTPGYIALAGAEAELSELLGGRQVDLCIPADLSRYFREDVMREAELQHAQWGPYPDQQHPSTPGAGRT